MRATSLRRRVAICVLDGALAKGTEMHHQVSLAWGAAPSITQNGYCSMQAPPRSGVHSSCGDAAGEHGPCTHLAEELHQFRFVVDGSKRVQRRKRARQCQPKNASF